MTAQEQLRALVRTHHANFTNQITAVDKLLSQRDQQGFVPCAQVVEAQGITHQMKGTAGSMGFPTVGAAAAALDTSLKGLKAQACPIAAADMRGALDLLASLRSVAGETTPEMSTLYNIDLSKLAR